MASATDNEGAVGRVSSAPPRHVSTATTSAGALWPAFIVLVLVSLLLYASSWLSVFSRWYSDPTYSHGFLVLAASIWMSYRAWARGELEGAKPDSRGLWILLAAGLVWLIATAASVEVVRQLTLPAMILSMAIILFGRQGLAALIVPVGLLYFVFPVWDFARPILQSITTAAVGGFLHSAGIPAAIHGYYVELPAGLFEIAEGCSGLHFLMAATALAAIQGYLFMRRWIVRIGFMIAAMIVAIVANWIRVAAVVIAGHETNMQHWLLNDHYYFGWLVFAVLMLPLIYLGRRFEPPAAANGQARLSFEWPAGSRRPVILALAGLASASLAWSALQLLSHPSPQPDFPDRVGEMRLSGSPSQAWSPVFPSADGRIGAAYEGQGRRIEAWLLYFSSQSNEREMVGFGNAFTRTSDGQLLDEEQPGKLRLLTGPGTVRLIEYRYNVAGRETTTGTGAKVLQVLGTLSGDPSGYVAAVSVECMTADCDASEVALESFLQALLQNLGQHAEQGS